jgi:hypothetical protein
MTDNTKLTKVLEYLIKNQEDKAKELLHQVFIEKARAIHEELMSDDDMQDDVDETMHGDMEEAAHDDEDMHDDMEEGMHGDMDEGMHGDMEEGHDDMVHGSGDLGEDLTKDIEEMDSEINFEEMMNEVDEVSADDAAGSAADDADKDRIASTISTLEKALQDLRDEFKLPSDDKVEDVEDMETVATDDEGDTEVTDVEDVEDMDDSDDEDSEMSDEDSEEEDEEDDEDVKEQWELDEDFADLAESLDLEVITKDMEKSQKSPKDAGYADSGMSKGANAKSPVPPSQTSRMGASPVKIGDGPTHKGYNLETAPKSDKLGIESTDNRRKTAEQGMKKMSKEGAPSAKLNHPEPKVEKSISPLTYGGKNLEGGKKK